MLRQIRGEPAQALAGAAPQRPTAGVDARPRRWDAACGEQPCFRRQAAALHQMLATQPFLLAEMKIAQELRHFFERNEGWDGR